MQTIISTFFGAGLPKLRTVHNTNDCNCQVYPAQTYTKSKTHLNASPLRDFTSLTPQKNWRRLVFPSRSANLVASNASVASAHKCVTTVVLIVGTCALTADSCCLCLCCIDAATV